VDAIEKPEARRETAKFDKPIRGTVTVVARRTVRTGDHT
jgi:hypothetical protein